MNDNTTQPIVSLARCPGYEGSMVEEALRRGLEPWGGMEKFVQPGQRVLLKPNFVLPRPPEDAATTHPAVIRAVALLVRKAGGEPVVGDSPAVGSVQKAARVGGVMEVARELGIEIIDLGTPRRFSLDGSGRARTLKLSGDGLDFPVVINLPKVKVHNQLYFTGAVKNCFGFVPGRRKAAWHLRLSRSVEDFARMIVATAQHVAPAFSIADGVISMEEKGPIRGRPRKTGFFVLGEDPMAVDRVLVELLGLDPGQVLTLRAGRERGFGETDLRQIDLRGDPLEELRVSGFVPSQHSEPIGFSLRHIILGLVRQVKARLFG